MNIFSTRVTIQFEKVTMRNITSTGKMDVPTNKLAVT